MQTKKAYASLVSMVVTVVIISVLILLILNNLYFRKPAIDNDVQADRYIEDLDQSKYESILQRSERTAESLKNKLEAQQSQIDRW